VLSRLRNRPPLFYGWVIVGTALTMNFASLPLTAAIFSLFVTPMTEDLGWSRSDLSWAFTVRLGIAGLSGPILGVLLDRLGPRVVGTLAGLLAGLMTLGLAGVNSLPVLYLLFAVSGLAGFGGPAGQLLTTVPVSKWFHLNRGRALAIASIGLPIGATFFILLEQALIDGIGWREAWAVSGVITLLMIVLPCALLMRKDPESIGLHPDGLDHPPAVLDPAQDSGRDNATSENWTTSQVLRSPAMWKIVLALACTGLVLPGTAIYRVAFWQDQGISPGVVAAATTLDAIAGLVSMVIFGFIAERVQTRYIGFAGGLIVGCSSLALIFASDSVLLLVLYNTAWGTGMGAHLTFNNIVWPNYYGRRFLGTIRGIVFPVIVGASALSAPLFAMLLEAAGDERHVWIVTMAAFWIAGLLIVSAKRPMLPTGPVEAPSASAARA
jgi:sugar phosphate permease